MTGIQDDSELEEDDKDGFSFKTDRSFEAPSPIDRNRAKKTMKVTPQKHSIRPVS